MRPSPLLRMSSLRRNGKRLKYPCILPGDESQLPQLLAVRMLATEQQANGVDAALIDTVLHEQGKQAREIRVVRQNEVVYQAHRRGVRAFIYEVAHKPTIMLELGEAELVLGMIHVSPAERFDPSVAQY